MVGLVPGPVACRDQNLPLDHMAPLSRHISKHESHKKEICIVLCSMANI